MGGSGNFTASGDIAPALSVIVPIFNTATPQLRRALRSAAGVGAHGYTVEIVAVDDGSEPGCRASIVRELDACRSDNVRVTLCTHAKNAGLATARNTGIVVAMGRWIMFLDSDDALIPWSVAALLREAEICPCPVICFQSAHATADDTSREPTEAYLALADAARSGTATASTVPELALVPSSWSQAYDRDWLLGQNLTFDTELRRWEDRPFLVAAQLAEPGTIRIWPHRVHRHYLDTGGSITKRRRDADDAAMMLHHIGLVHDAIETAGLSDTDFAAIHWWISVSRLLSVAGPGAACNRAVTAAVFRTGVNLVARRPHVAHRHSLPAPHPMLPIARLPGPLRNTLVWVLAHPRNPVARLGMRAGFRFLDIRRRRRKKPAS